MSPPAIGALRRRVRLLAPAITPDAGGGRAIAEVCEADVWAAVIARTPRERVEADALTSLLTFEVWLRFREDVRPGWRVRWAAGVGQRTVRVRHVRDLEDRGRWLVLDCEEEIR